MQIKLFALLAGIPVISVSLTWLVLEQNNDTESLFNAPKKKSELKIADTFLEQAVIINFSETGTPKNKIITQQILHYPGDQESEISLPQITLFRPQGSPTLVTADVGWINQEGTRITLEGHTIVRRDKTQYNAFSQLETPELIVWPKNNYVESDKSIKLTTDATIVTGIGMEAYLTNEHYYILKDVKVHHKPVKR